MIKTMLSFIFFSSLLLFPQTTQVDSLHKQSGSIRITVTPAGSVAALSGEGIASTQWQGTKTFKNIPAGQYRLRCRMENYASLDTMISVSADQDLGVKVILGERSYEVKGGVLTEVQLSEPDVVREINGHEWLYSCICPGLGQYKSGRATVAVISITATVVASVYYILKVVDYNDALSLYNGINNDFRLTPIEANKSAVLKRKKDAESKRDNAYKALAYLGATYFLNVVEAFIFQPKETHVSLSIIPFEKTGNENILCTFQVRVPL